MWQKNNITFQPGRDTRSFIVSLWSSMLMIIADMMLIQQESADLCYVMDSQGRATSKMENVAAKGPPATMSKAEIEAWRRGEGTPQHSSLMPNRKPICRDLLRSRPERSFKRRSFIVIMAKGK